MKNYIEVEYKEMYDEAVYIRKYYAIKEPLSTFDPPIIHTAQEDIWHLGIRPVTVRSKECIAGLRKLLDAIEEEL